MNEHTTAVNRAKRAAFDALLPLCPYVHFMPSAKNVSVVQPSHDRPLETYRYGRTPSIMNIPDLDITDAGIAGTVSMRGSLHRTFVPWSAIAFITVNDDAGELRASLSFAIELADLEPEKPEPAPQREGNVIQFKPRAKKEVQRDEKEGA